MVRPAGRTGSRRTRQQPHGLCVGVAGTVRRADCRASSASFRARRHLGFPFWVQAATQARHRSPGAVPLQSVAPASAVVRRRSRLPSLHDDSATSPRGIIAQRSYLHEQRLLVFGRDRRVKSGAECSFRPLTGVAKNPSRLLPCGGGFCGPIRIPPAVPRCAASTPRPDSRPHAGGR